MSFVETFGILFTSDASDLERETKKAAQAVESTEKKISDAGAATDELDKKFAQAAKSANQIAVQSGQTAGQVAMIGKEAGRSKGQLSGVDREFGFINTNADLSAKSLTGSFRTMLGFAGGITAVGVAAGAAVAKVAKEAKKVEDVSRLTERLGLDTSAVIAWGEAVRDSGGDAQAFQGTIQGITMSIEDARKGQGSLLQSLAQIQGYSGVDIQLRKDNGEYKTSLELLGDLSDAFVKLRPAEATKFAAGLGIDQGTINLLLSGRSALDDLVASQKAHADALAKEAEAAKRLSKAQADISRKTDRFIAKRTDDAAILTEAFSDSISGDFDSAKNIASNIGDIFKLAGHFVGNDIAGIFSSDKISAIESSPLIAPAAPSIINQSAQSKSLQVSVGDVNVDARGGDSQEISSGIGSKLLREIENATINLDDGVAR